jgi:PAS domain S-box-containing protein
MNLTPLLLKSLKTRVTLFTLTVFVLSIWTLAEFTSHVLHEDLQALLEKQQLSTATIVAAEVNQELGDRLAALGMVSKGIDMELLADSSALSRFLEKRPVLMAMFNAGVFVTGGDGTALASIPLDGHRVGVNYMAFDHIASALRQGKAAIGEPYVGKESREYMMSMVAPIRDARGQVRGALVGTIDLNLPNFFDKITGNHYGRTGSYLLISRSAKKIVAGTEKRRLFEALPGHDVGLVVEHFLTDVDGAGMATNQQGESFLVAVKTIAVTDWLLAVQLPAAEAFAVIHDMERRVFWVALLLTILAGVLTWWMLRRQLAPLINTARTLSDFSDTQQFPASLPPSGNDEIGQLIQGFNLLLGNLRQRNAALQDSEQRFRTLIEWTPEAIAVHRDGKMLYLNPAAVKLFGASSAQEIVGKPMMDLVAPDFREIELMRVKRSQEEAVNLPTLEEKFQKLDGSIIDVEVTGRLISFEGKPAHQVAMRDVTERKRADEALQATLRDKLALLNEVHHRVKNNLQVITSLLRLESSRSALPDTRNVLQEMQGRIRSMAMLHETLYRSGTFAAVDLGAYLKQLATEAFRAQASSHSAVLLKLELASVQVNMDLATPCGLLVNELISNCLKHGFVDGRSGEIRVELLVLPALSTGATPCRLSVSDSGVGLPTDWEIRRNQSLGLQLVSDLSRQIGAKLSVKPAPGSEFALSFEVATVVSGVSPV